MIIEDQEIQPENSTKQQLALAVRSIHWSYAVFWSLSTAEQGVLEWGAGYYHGQIKTKKSLQTKDVDNQKLGLDRSEQLRKLYEALLEGESEQGTKKLAFALSLEDLSDLEWYYLVSMSFTFKVGQGLPGRAMATGQHIWLYDAQSADSKVFSRSLLAKSASIQTIICFPHMGGVIELGVTDLVSEDINLIQHIKIIVLQLTKPVCSHTASSAPQKADSDKDQNVLNVNENDMVDTTPFSSLHHSIEQMNFDQEIENGLYQSVLEDFTGFPADCSNDSYHHAKDTTINRFRVPLVKPVSSNSSSVKDDETKDYPLSLQAYDVYMQDFTSEEITANVLLSELEDKRENQLYMVHEPMVPSITEIDEAFILTNMTGYLGGVDELETNIDLEGTSATKDLNMLKQTSDSYNMSKAPEINETDPDLAKAIQMDNLQPLDIDMEVSIVAHEVLITMKCPWREYLLIRIMEVLNNLNLETHTVQSSTLDGTLSLFLKLKFQKTPIASEGMIKQALKRTVGMC